MFALFRSYHEAHEEREAKNLKVYKLVFVHLRVLCGEWQMYYFSQ